MNRKRLTLTAEDAVILTAGAATATDRTLRGLALPYGAPGRTSAGLVKASKGRITWAGDLRRIKVLAGHNREKPVGYLTLLTEDDEGLHAEMHMASTADGEVALLEAREGTRDAISVELENVELSDDGDIISAELVAVALLPLPAFSDARIAAEDTEQPAEVVIREPEDSGDDDDDDEDTDEDNQEDAVTPTTAPPVQAARAPAELAASRGKNRARTMTLEMATAQVAAKFRESDRSATALNAALADITPVTTNWAAVQPYQWVGELWTPTFLDLPWNNAVSKGTLTAMKIVGFKRLPPDPVIQPYAGNKAPIPTDGKLQFGPVDVTAVRHAVGADFDRIFLDFGDESVITTWLQLVSQSYAKVLDDAIGAAVLAEATDGGNAPDFISGVSLAAQTLKKAGARASWIAVAADIYADFLNIKTADAPWWLTGSSSVSLGDQTANINSLPNIFESEEIPDGTIVAGDKRAVTQYTPRGNPFTVRAVDLPKGGLDVAVFGYSAELVNDPKGIVSVTVGAVTP